MSNKKYDWLIPSIYTAVGMLAMYVGLKLSGHLC